MAKEILLNNFKSFIHLSFFSFKYEDFITWNRAKINIPFKDIVAEDGKHNRIFNIEIVSPDDNDNGKPVHKIVTSITDLRKELEYACTAQFYLEIKSLWIIKATRKHGKKITHDCGLKITCNKINIIKKKEQLVEPQKENYNWDLDFSKISSNDEDSEDNTIIDF